MKYPWNSGEVIESGSELTIEKLREAYRSLHDPERIRQDWVYKEWLYEIICKQLEEFERTINEKS